MTGRLECSLNISVPDNIFESMNFVINSSSDTASTYLQDYYFVS